MYYCLDVHNNQSESQSLSSWSDFVLLETMVWLVARKIVDEALVKMLNHVAHLKIL